MLILHHLSEVKWLSENTLYLLYTYPRLPISIPIKMSEK